MPYLIGLVLSSAVALMARGVGLDRDRAFYPTAAIVIASYGVLFATIGGSSSALVAELVVMLAFTVLAVVGFRSNPWLVVAALAGHGLFDAVHGHVIDNAGMPAWWPAFCASYDLGAGAWLAWLVRRDSRGPAAGYSAAIDVTRIVSDAPSSTPTTFTRVPANSRARA